MLWDLYHYKTFDVDDCVTTHAVWTKMDQKRLLIHHPSRNHIFKDNDMTSSDINENLVIVLPLGNESEDHCRIVCYA